MVRASARFLPGSGKGASIEVAWSPYQMTSACVHSDSSVNAAGCDCGRAIFQMMIDAMAEIRMKSSKKAKLRRPMLAGAWDHPCERPSLAGYRRWALQAAGLRSGAYSGLGRFWFRENSFDFGGFEGA